MYFFKKHNGKSKVIPYFPTGNCGIEPTYVYPEAVHSGVRSFHHPTFLIHFPSRKDIPPRNRTFSSVGTDIGDETKSLKRPSEFPCIKYYIEIAEKAICRDVGVIKLLHTFFYYPVNLENIRGYYETTVPILQVEVHYYRSGRAHWRYSSSYALVCNILPSSVDGGMSTIDMQSQKINLVLVFSRSSVKVPFHSPA